MHLSSGNYLLTNELLQETGRFEFVPGDWAKTPDGKNAFPMGPIGFHYLAATFYFVGGNYGLFYLGPIFGVLFFIIAERFATKVYGNYVGLLTLLFLVTNHLLLRSFQSLQTEGIFGILFILGVYFLIKFFNTKNELWILLSSLFLMLSTLMRTNGIIFFPIEVILVGGYAFYQIYKNRKEKMNNSTNSKLTTNLQLFSKKSIKTGLLLIIPWILFFIYWFSFNAIFFDDPFTNQYIEQRGPENTDAKLSSLFELSEKNFENTKQYSKFVLPYQFPGYESKLSIENPEISNNNLLGIITFVVISIALIVSFKTKDKRKEILISILFILGTIWLFASVTNQERAAEGVVGRYMLPAFTMFYPILGFLILKLFNFKISSQKKIVQRLIKILVLISLTIFFITAFYFSPLIQEIINQEFQINDPSFFSKNHPPNLEGIAKNDVIFAVKTDRSLEYGAISFHYLPHEHGGPKDSTEILKDTLQKNYKIFIFKEPTTTLEKSFLNDLVKEHNLILKDFSTSFCKIEIKKPDDKSNMSDKICLN